MILIKKETEKDGNTVYEMGELMVEYFLLSIKKMNMTVVFLQPSLELSFGAVMTEATQLTAGIADVVVGIVPMLPLVVTGMTKPSIPCVSGVAKWFLPCPKPISRVDRFSTVFDASVWLTMLIVFVLTSTLFWFSVNYPDRMVQIDSKNFQTISKCMYNSWSIFIGVSVPEMPRSWKLRIFFLIYVFYCFAMSTVFQAFFVSYLVEPGYGEKISTFEELLDSNINYGFIGVVEFGMSTMEFSDHLQFPPTRRVDCVDLKNCLRRMIIDGDVATISSTGFNKYLSNELGYQDQVISLCSLDETFIYGSIVAVFTKGNLVLYQFNTHLRRVLESGIAFRYLGQLKYEAILRGRTTSEEDGSIMFFVFTLSHMGPAFIVLGFGYVFSTIVCIAECLYKRFSKCYQAGNRK